MGEKKLNNYFDFKIKKAIVYGVVLFLIALAAIEIGSRVFISAYYFYRDRIRFSNAGAEKGANEPKDLKQQKNAVGCTGNLIFHPYLSYVPMPNQNYSNVKTNKDGFRYSSSEISAKKPRGTYRIFMTGGSVAWIGSTLNNNTTLADLLEKFLNGGVRASNRTSKYEVINAGVWAYSITQEILRILLYIKEYDPDMIIMYSGINDIYFSYRGIDTYKNGNDFFNVRKIIQDKYGTSTSLKNGIFGSQYPGKEKIAYELSGKPVPDDYKLKSIFLIKRLQYRHLLKRLQKDNELSISIKPDEYFENVLRPAFQLLDDFAEIKKIPIVFVLQPTLWVTDKKLTEREKAIMGRLDFIGDLYRAKPFYEEFYRKYPGFIKRYQNITFISHVDVFDKIEKSVYTDPFHFQDAGNEIAAKRLAGEILEIIEKNRQHAL